MKPLILPPGKARAAELEKALAQVAAYHPDKPIRLKWEIARPDRTAQQNKFLWAVPYELICQETGFEKEELHEWFCGQKWGWVDRKVPKTPNNPRGIESRPVRTTTRDENGELDICSREDFVSIWEHAMRVGAKIGVIIPDPDPDWWKK